MLASGPLTTSPSAISVTAISATSVIAIWIGLSFQNGRPSSTPYTVFIARVNAPMYPDADHSAPSRPRTSSAPAACCSWMTSRIGSSSAEIAPPAPMSSMIPSSVSTVFSPSDTTPASATRTMIDGNSASTP